MQQDTPSQGQSVDGLIGRTVGGYRIGRFIARGGMGVVYEGSQLSLDRPVAIKILYPHLSDDPTFVERFQREARSEARLNHPHIVRVLDFGVDNGTYYMVMDFIDGESLRELLARVGTQGLTLNTNTMMKIVEEVGSALMFAHGLGLVHRDVKPGNVLLGKDGNVYLADFGVVKILGESSMTIAGTIVGTPEYMAPEQSTGISDIGPAADLYSLAIITYEMMVGRVPFKAPTPTAVLQMQLTQPPPPPSTLVPWFAPEVEEVIMRALAKEPAHRYPSVDAYVQALEVATAGIRERATNRYAAAASMTAATVVDGPFSVGGTPPPAMAPQYNTATGTVTPPSSASMAASVAGDATYGAAAAAAPSFTGTPTGAGAVPPAGSTGATPPSTVGPFPQAQGNSRGRFILIGVILLALIGLAAYVFTRNGGNEETVRGTETSPGLAAYSTLTAYAVGSAAINTPVATPSVAGTTISGVGTDPTATNGSTIAASPTAVQGEPTVTTAASPTAQAAPTETIAAVATATGIPGAAPPGYKSVILFSSHRGDVHDSEIYIMNPDGSDQHQLTFSRGHSWGPRVSPDGTQFIFSSVAPGEHATHDATGGGQTGSGNHDIYVSNVDGSNITKLTFTTSWDNGWSWSPDGRWITFTSDRTGNWEIFRMNPDGTDVVQLTDSPTEDGWPAWTPDGKKIVFGSDRTGDWEIFSMNADGTGITQLTNRPDTVDTFPYVSPDGKKIVFSSQVASANEGEIYVMDIDGGNVTRLTSTVALNYAPSWAPDGSKIIFVSDRDGNHNIYIMNPDGTDQQRLTDDPGEDTTPCWAWIKVGS